MVADLVNSPSTTEEPEKKLDTPCGTSAAARASAALAQQKLLTKATTARSRLINKHCGDNFFFLQLRWQHHLQLLQACAVLQAKFAFSDTEVDEYQRRTLCELTRLENKYLRQRIPKDRGLGDPRSDLQSTTSSLTAMEPTLPTATSEDPPTGQCFQDIALAPGSGINDMEPVHLKMFQFLPEMQPALTSMTALLPEMPNDLQPMTAFQTAMPSDFQSIFILVHYLSFVDILDRPTVKLKFQSNILCWLRLLEDKFKEK